MKSKDDSERRVLSRKELAREIRHAAYVKAKERRKNDPRVLAMKEAAKKQRRELYQRVKEQRKAAGAEQKKRETERRAADRAAADAELMKKVVPLSAKGSTALN
jgi:hypothetical protein